MESNQHEVAGGKDLRHLDDPIATKHRHQSTKLESLPLAVKKVAPVTSM